MANYVCIIGLILYKKSDLIFIKFYYILVINDFIKEKLYLISCIKMMQIKSQIVAFKIIKCIKWYFYQSFFNKYIIRELIIFQKYRLFIKITGIK